jgi:hypothetical protein
VLDTALDVFEARSAFLMERARLWSELKPVEWEEIKDYLIGYPGAFADEGTFPPPGFPSPTFAKGWRLWATREDISTLV